MTNKIKKIIDNYGGLILGLAIIFYILFFSLASVWKYYNFGYNALDLAIINQAFFNSSQGNFFALSIHPPTYLGDHFTPILILLLPVYFLFKHPISLLILQTLALGLSSWPLYLISKNVLNKNWALLIGLAWVLNPYVGNINLFEFHFLPFAVFFIFWIFYFFLTNKFWPFIIFSCLALLVQEDVSLVIFMFGILAILAKRKAKWWLTPLVISTAYFLTVLKFINLFTDSGQYKFFIYYSWLGENWVEFIKNLLLKPWAVAAHLINFGNLEFIIGLLMPLAFIPLINPLYLLLGLGIFTQLVLGSAGGSGTLLQIHYSALLLPPLFISTIYAIKKIADSPKNTKNKIIKLIKQDTILSGLIFLVAIIFSWVTLSPTTGVLSGLVKQGISWPETKIKNELIKKIPVDAPVATTYEFLPHLSSRKKLYSFNYVFLGKQQFLYKDYSLPTDTEYLLIDYRDLITYQLQYGQNPFYKNQYNEAVKNWAKILKDFGLIEINDTLALYQKGEKDEFKLVQILESKPEIKAAGNIILADEIEFLGYNQLTGNHFQFFWQAATKLEKNYQLQLSLEKDGKPIYEEIYPLAYNILPTTTWQPNQIIQTDYWFEFNKKIPPGNYDLKINIIEIQKGGIEIDPIRSTKDVIDKKAILGPAIDFGQI